MKRFLILLVILFVAGVGHLSHAHPSAGLVVTEKGVIYFVHSGVGVARVETNGTLTYVKRSKGGHWLRLDAEGKFARTQPKFFERITPDGEKPAIIFADGGAPIAMRRDGQLYFGSNWERGDEHPPGGLTVSRQTVDGKLSVATPELAGLLRNLNEGVTGLAAGKNGNLYVASPRWIWQVNATGKVQRVTSTPFECADGSPNHKPEFRGLCATPAETIYAAATGCGSVVAITNGSYVTVLKSELPWSPTDVAWHDGNLFVLEWTNPNGHVSEGWRPRVRKLARDGKITTLAEVKEYLPVP